MYIFITAVCAWGLPRTSVLGRERGDMAGLQSQPAVVSQAVDLWNQFEGQKGCPSLSLPSLPPSGSPGSMDLAGGCSLRQDAVQPLTAARHSLAAPRRQRGCGALQEGC